MKINSVLNFGENVKQFFNAVVGLSVFVIVWALLVWFTNVAEYLIPSPGQVGDALWDGRQVIWGHLLTTVSQAGIGLVLGVLFGLVVAIILSYAQSLRSIIEPLLVVSQSVPAVVLAPLFIIWFGFGMLPKIIVVALVTFFPIVLAALSGFDSVSADLHQLFDSLKVRKLARLFHLQIPSATEEIFAGLKIATSYAIFGAVIAEWMGGSSGLGIYLKRSDASYKTDQVFAAVVVIAIVSIFFYSLVVSLERYAMPYKKTHK